jgi:hypothetical protein
VFVPYLASRTRVRLNAAYEYSRTLMIPKERSAIESAAAFRSLSDMFPSSDRFIVPGAPGNLRRCYHAMAVRTSAGLSIPRVRMQFPHNIPATRLPAYPKVVSYIFDGPTMSAANVLLALDTRTKFDYCPLLQAIGQRLEYLP